MGKKVFSQLFLNQFQTTSFINQSLVVTVVQKSQAHAANDSHEKSKILIIDHVNFLT